MYQNMQRDNGANLPTWSSSLPTAMDYNQGFLPNHYSSSSLTNQPTPPAYSLTVDPVNVPIHTQLPDYYSNPQLLFNVPIDTQPDYSFTNPQLPLNVPIHTGPAYSNPQLPFNVPIHSEFAQDIPHIEGDSIYGNCAYGPLSSVVAISNVEILESEESSSLGHKKRGPNYVNYSKEEVIQLIDAVRFHGKRWRKIVELQVFKDKGRKNTHLMEKWRHMLSSADRQKDPELRALYIRAKEVDDFVKK